MTCSIREAVQGDEQRICELFIEMLQTDGRKYDLHSSLIDGYNINSTGIVVY